MSRIGYRESHFRQAISSSNLRVLVALLLVLPMCAAAQTIRFSRYAAVSGSVGELRWFSVPGADRYAVYRHYPNQEGFSLVASIPDTHYLDTLHRVICGDTVSYRVEAECADGLHYSGTVGIYYFDDVPTAPCALRVCTVDTALDRIRLSWYPTPDTDAIGYYICLGSPCVDYDTVWGRLNTSYLCPIDLPADSQFRFRVLAFDSCYQASPLTPSYHNPVLRFPDTGCTRRFRCTWNRYVNMPDSVGRYRLHYRLEGETAEHVFETGPDGPFEFDMVVDDLSIGSVDAYLTVHNTSDSLQAFSRVGTFRFASGDTAEYVRIAGIAYDENEPSVGLVVEIDTLFIGQEYYVYRSQGDDGNVVQIATVSREFPPQRQQYFKDTDIRRDAGKYAYQVGIYDLCNQWVKMSDTVQIILPELAGATAYFPNAVIYGHPDCGSFCPSYVSPLAKDYQLDIFTRWGEQVFHTTNITDCWSGTTASGHPLPQGVYVYYAKVCHADGTVQTYKGTILLVR